MPGDLQLAPRGPSHSFRRKLAVVADSRRRDEDSDLRLFVMAYTAFFICFYTLIF